jgi:hypothetical protein
MNRVYQGRVSYVEIFTGDNTNPWKPFHPDPEIARRSGRMLSGNTTNFFRTRWILPDDRRK